MAKFDNPYQHAEPKNHVPVKSELIRNLLIVNSLFMASGQLASTYDAPNEDPDNPLNPEHDFTLIAHYKNAERIIIDTLLIISISFRTADDGLKAHIGKDAYNQIVKKIGNDIFNEEESYIREAWNKIIHAADLRPLYRLSDYADNKHEIWYMTGEMELTAYPGERWTTLTLYVPAFIEACFRWLHITTKP